MIALATTSLATACNLINGSHDRVIDTDDSSSTTDPDRDTGTPANDSGNGDEPDTSVAARDADADADTGPGIITITFGTDWVSPNGALFSVDGTGTTITQLGTAANSSHGVILPNPLTQPAIESDNYTVLATVRCPNSAANAEFGILTRVQGSGVNATGATILASKSGTDASPFEPFMGNFDTTWNPSIAKSGVDAGFLAGGRYFFKLVVVGQVVSGTMWPETEQEPATPDTQIASTWATGRGAGFYTFGLNFAVLEKLQVTIP